MQATLCSPDEALILRHAGDAVRAARLRAGISQQLLGLMTGTTQQSVSRWEQGLGAPEPATQLALVDILGVAVGLWAATETRLAS